MNSLVVFLSVVALAAAKPSGLALNAGVITYSSPVIAAAPAAVSHQSRLDIKSTPAVVATAAIEPIARTVIAAPAVATAAIAPAAVSSQSRIDIKSTPAITSTVVSAPVAYSAPALAYNAPALAYSAPALAYNTPALAYSAPALAYNAPLIAGAVVKTGLIAPTLLKTAIAAPALPLDTPEVLAARAAHFEAKALAEAHLIKKRSASLIAAPLLSTPLAAPITTAYTASPLISSYHAAPLAYSAPFSYAAPLGLSTPLITKAYGVHPW